MVFKKRDVVYAEIEPGDGTLYQILVVNTHDSGSDDVYIGAGMYLGGGHYIGHFAAKTVVEWALQVSAGEVATANAEFYVHEYMNKTGLVHEHTVIVAHLAAAAHFWGELERDLELMVSEYYRPSVDNGSLQRIFDASNQIGGSGVQSLEYEDVFPPKL